VRLFSQDTKAQALGRAPLFEGLSKKDLLALAKATEDLEVAAGKVLCREGSIGHEFFVIVEGEVEIVQKGKSIGTRRAPDFIGEIALIENVRRTATVTATTPLRLFVLTRQSFWGLVERHPQVERKILTTLAKRLLRDASDA
jgi:CRP/FNR family transcriptional regulator